MKRYKIIIEIWKYGMEFPNFPINELEDYLKAKTKSADDINFGLAYVRKNFIKNQNLDEYLIDQNSISNFISMQQKRTAYWALGVSIAAFIITTISVVYTFQNKKDITSSKSYIKDKSIKMNTNGPKEWFYSSAVWKNGNNFTDFFLDAKNYADVSCITICDSNVFPIIYPLGKQTHVDP